MKNTQRHVCVPDEFSIENTKSAHTKHFFLEMLINLKKQKKNKTIKMAVTVSYSHSTGASFNIKPTNSYLAGRPGMITKEKEPNWFESASLAQWFIFILKKKKK